MPPKSNHGKKKKKNLVNDHGIIEEIVDETKINITEVPQQLVSMTFSDPVMVVREQEYMNLKQENMNLKQELSATNGKYDSLKASYESNIKTIETLKKENEELRKELKELKQSMAEMKQYMMEMNQTRDDDKMIDLLKIVIIDISPDLKELGIDTENIRQSRNGDCHYIRNGDTQQLKEYKKRCIRDKLFGLTQRFIDKFEYTFDVPNIIQMVKDNLNPGSFVGLTQKNKKLAEMWWN